MSEVNVISELNDDRYVVIDQLVNNDDVLKYMKSIEKIQIELMKHNIDAREMYEYLVTIMINQC